jgi:hypothetical protein
VAVVAETFHPVVNVLCEFDPDVLHLASPAVLGRAGARGREELGIAGGGLPNRSGGVTAPLPSDAAAPMRVGVPA